MSIDSNINSYYEDVSEELDYLKKNEEESEKEEDEK